MFFISEIENLLSHCYRIEVLMSFYVSVFLCHLHMYVYAEVSAYTPCIVKFSSAVLRTLVHKHTSQAGGWVGGWIGNHYMRYFGHLIKIKRSKCFHNNHSMTPLTLKGILDSHFFCWKYYLIPLQKTMVCWLNTLWPLRYAVLCVWRYKERKP